MSRVSMMNSSSSSALSRAVACDENIEIAEYLCAERDRTKVESNLFKTIHVACQSLCEHPTAVTSLYEANQVRNIGPQILKKLKVFFDSKNVSDPATQTSSQEPTGRNGKVKKQYYPKKGSATFALSITLLRAHQSGKEFMKKEELIDATEISGLSGKPIRPNPMSWNSGQSNAKYWRTGWSGMKTLTENCLVVKSSNPAQYKLTDNGKLVAQECLNRAGLNQYSDSGHGLAREEDMRASPGREGGEFCSRKHEVFLSSDENRHQIRRCHSKEREDDQFLKQQTGIDVDSFKISTSQQSVSANPNPQSAPVIRTARAAANLDRHDSVNSAQVQSFSTIEASSVDVEDELAVPPLKAGEKFCDVYDIACILDCREKFGRKGLASFAEGLQTQFKVNVMTRQLPVGDALWIARHKHQDEEYVLDFVVERKEVKDLWSSIKNNAYKAQKLRLMNCGLMCLLYLVEGDVNKVESTDALRTAMFTTEIQDGFHVLRTTGLDDTKRQYGNLTSAILSRYNMEVGKAWRSSRVCRTYREFSEQCVDFQKDQITVSAIFCCQLSQISQITEDVACSIQTRYPTLVSIVQAYNQLEGNQDAQEKLLQGIPIRNSTKTISAVMSKKVYKVIWAQSYE